MVGSVYKACVSKGKCKTERCKHGYWLDYKPADAKRVRMSIHKAFGVACYTRMEAETLHLPAFIKEINAAHKERRVPFVKQITAATITTISELVDEWVLRYHGVLLKDCPDKDLKSRCAIIKRDLGSSAVLAMQEEDPMGDYKTKKLAETHRNGAPKALATTNRVLSDLRTMFSWAKTRGYVTKTPFHKHGVTIDTGQEIRRDRRLADDEEDSLLSAALRMATAQFQCVGKRLYRCLIGALDTGMRQGEMLRVQVEDVQWHGPLGSSIKVPFYKVVNGERVRNSKHERTKAIPITERLYELLVERRLLGPKAFLFGTDDGQYVERITTSWETLILIAHGYPFARDKKKGRPEEQRLALAAIDLHFHDLRHEAISRWAEAEGSNGEALFAPHELMALAGHKNLSTTQRYLNAKDKRLTNQMAKFSGQQRHTKRKVG
jgi:integrase